MVTIITNQDPFLGAMTKLGFFERCVKKKEKHWEGNNNHPYPHHSEWNAINILAYTLNLNHSWCHVNSGLGFPKRSGLTHHPRRSLQCKWRPWVPQLQQGMRAASEQMCLSFLHFHNSHWAPRVQCSGASWASENRPRSSPWRNSPLVQWRKTFSKQCKKRSDSDRARITELRTSTWVDLGLGLQPPNFFWSLWVSACFHKENQWGAY